MCTYGIKIPEQNSLAIVSSRKFLGNIFAHEIGHVLQDVARHSESGLMKAVWMPQDLSEMKSSRLSFDSEGRDFLRTGMSRLTTVAAEAAATNK